MASRTPSASPAAPPSSGAGWQGGGPGDQDLRRDTHSGAELQDQKQPRPYQRTHRVAGTDFLNSRTQCHLGGSPTAHEPTETQRGGTGRDSELPEPQDLASAVLAGLQGCKGPLLTGCRGDRDLDPDREPECRMEHQDSKHPLPFGQVPNAQISAMHHDVRLHNSDAALAQSGKDNQGQGSRPNRRSSKVRNLGLVKFF